MKRLLILLYLFSNLNAYTQSNIWYFGNYAGLKFNGSGAPTNLTNSSMWTGEGSAIATDINGDLLFYTDGISVWNSKHNKEFSGMKGHPSSTQTALIIPIPETNCKKFFIFTVGGVEDFSLGANVTLVELSGDSKNGTNIKKIDGPTRMFSASVTEKLNGVHDGNGGYWIVNHEWKSDKFHSFHVTKNTDDITKLLATNTISQIGLTQGGILTNGQGQMKFSKDGSKMALAVAEDKYVEIYDFNLTNGKLSNVQLIQNNDPNFPTNKTIFTGTANLYGLEFSSNGNFLYVAEFFTGGNASVFQFNISYSKLEDIRNSKVILGTSSHSSRYPYGAMLIAPNDKIYIARSDRQFLATIENPNSSGTSCNFKENGITLSRTCYNGLPTTIYVDLCCSISKPFLGNDTSICFGQQLILKDTVKGVSSYLWSDSSKNATLTVKKSGTYWIEIGNGDCKKRDTISVIVNKVPKADLGRDTLVCGKTNFTISIKNSGSNYLWSTSETTQNITTSKSGKYWVRIDSNGCRASDTLLLSLSPLTKPQLGKDTTLCEGASIQLVGISNNAKSYTWSNGDKIPQTDVKSSGTYILQVTDNICTLSDTIKVDFIPFPKVFLGRDTGFCGNFTLQLNAGNPGLNKIWSTNETTETITVSNLHGNYWVEVSNLGCKTKSSITINKLTGPQVNLGRDSIYCKQISITLNAQNPGCSYLWNTGQTNQTLAISMPGKYWVAVSDLKGCVHSDTIILQDSSIQFELGNDTSICQGQEVLLKGLTMPLKHSWHTGETSSTLLINKDGLYKLQISNGKCSVSDSLKLTVFPVPTIELGNDTFICEELNESIDLSVKSGYKSYSWSPYGETSETIVANKAGIYEVTVIDYTNCSAKDKIEIINDCPVSFFLPTAFNPNSGGLNAKFGVSYIGPPVSEYEMLIFNRWGELLFISNDINGSWDGNFMEKPCQLGMYMCLISFKTKRNTEVNKYSYKGMFLLVR